MLCLEDIKIEAKCQGLEAKQLSVSPKKDRAIIYVESKMHTQDINCPDCAGQVHIHDSFDITLKDIPLYPDMPLSLFCTGHRYRCQKYSKLKKSRWTLLMKHEKLSEDRSEHLDAILETHHDLAVCYAMKEEMCRLFGLTDSALAEKGWNDWFRAAEESNIPALVRFANLKKQRIKGLIAHANHPISTGKLEGFNNKIKVAKRIGYGYRNEAYFFKLIRYLALPSVRSSYPNFP